MSSCYLGYPLLNILLALAHAQDTEHSAAVNASSFEQASSGSPASPTNCAALHAPTLERSGSPAVGHNISSKMVAHRLKLSTVMSQVWQSPGHGYCPHMTPKSKCASYSPPKIQDLLENSTSLIKCLSSQTDPLLQRREQFLKREYSPFSGSL